MAAPPSKAEHIVVRHRNGAGEKPEYRTKRAELGPLGERSILDTPFSVMTVPQDVILNQQARNLNDLARYLPSVQLEQRGDPGISRPQSRGFEGDVVSNSRMNGLNVVATTPYAAEQFSGLSVLNGLAGALYGPQNPAGTFSYTLKRPTDRAKEQIVVGTDSVGAPLETLDLSGRRRWFGYHLTLLNQQGESYVRDSHVRRNLVSGDVDIHLSERTVLQLDASQYSTAMRGLQGQFSYDSGLSLPRAPDLGRPYYGQKQGGYNSSTDTALARIIHRIDDRWSVTLGGLYQNAARTIFTTANQFLDDTGRYRQRIAAAPTAKAFKLGSNIAYLNGKFRLAGLKHQLALGTNGYVVGNYNPLFAQSFTLGEARLGHPRAFPGPQPRSSGTYKSADTMVQALIIGDTLSYGRHWSVMGLLSWSWIRTHNYAKSGQKTADYSRSGAFSPIVALIYKPVADQSFYATWGRSLQAGPTAPAGSQNVNDVLAPLRSEEYELGYKFLWRKRLQLNLAAFRMTRPYAYTDPQTRVFGTFGEQRNYGVEFQLSGNLTRRLSVLGGVTWLDAQLGQTAQSATSHKEVVGVAPLQANLLLDYRLPFLRGAAVNANIHYTGRRAANVYNTTFAGSYTILDLGARYVTRVYRQPLTFRFGVENVTNQSYWASVYPSSINGGGAATNTAMAGLPRTYHVTLTLDL